MEQLQKKPTTEQLLAIIAFTIQTLKDIFSSRTFKGRLAKQNREIIMQHDQLWTNQFELDKAQSELLAKLEQRVKALEAKGEKPTTTEPQDASDVIIEAKKTSKKK